MSDSELFKREVNAFREVVDAKMDSVWGAIDGIKNILERLTTSVEKQNELHVQTAVLTNTVAHVQRMQMEDRAYADEQFTSLQRRIEAVEGKQSVKEWRSKGLWAAIVAGIAATGTVVTANFETIVTALFGG